MHSAHVHAPSHQTIEKIGAGDRNSRLRASFLTALGPALMADHGLWQLATHGWCPRTLALFAPSPSASDGSSLSWVSAASAGGQTGGQAHTQASRQASQPVGGQTDEWSGLKHTCRHISWLRNHSVCLAGWIVDYAAGQGRYQASRQRAGLLAMQQGKAGTRQAGSRLGARWPH